MRKPRQHAARQRWAARLQLIGQTLAILRDKAAPNVPGVEVCVHLSTLSRATKIPPTSLRSIADAAFTEIVVPGNVVGWSGNYFYIAPAEPRP